MAHLEAALAVWRYSLDSARWIFGDTTADEIWALAKHRPNGITRTEVRDLFSRNKKAREIDRALTVLEEARVGRAPSGAGPTPINRLVHGEGPVLGEGSGADGSWELRAVYEEESLHFYIALFNPDGQKVAGGGVGGIARADDARPIVISMSRRGLHSTFCWIGQVIMAADTVELTLTDGSAVAATVLESDLPVKLFVAFTDRTAVPIRFRATGPDGELDTLEIDEHWPGDGNELWGPIHDEDDDSDGQSD
jgi:hypothetical protein